MANGHRAKIGTKPVNKGVYFNLEKPMDKKLYDYVTDESIINYSAFIKGLIYKHIEETGGAFNNPYEKVEQGLRMSPVEVKVPHQPISKPVYEEEDLVEEYIEPTPAEPEAVLDEGIAEEEVEDEVPVRTNNLANFGAMSAKERRRNRNN